jgi:hypothetical protein
MGIVGAVGDVDDVGDVGDTDVSVDAANKMV